MRKTILNFIAILAIVYALLSWLTSGSGYNKEKELWKINNKYNFVTSHMESTPDFEIDQLADKYKAFAHKYPNSIYSQHAYMKLGDLNIKRKIYDQARIEYQKAIGKDPGISALALFAIGKTYEEQGQWESTLPVYKEIIRKYPLTNTGFYLPMYLGDHAASSSDPAAAPAVYNDALRFYAQLAAKYPKSEIGFESLRMVSLCQIKLNEWSAAVKTIGEITLKYPSNKLLATEFNDIGYICSQKSKDYDLGISLYNQFLKKYPTHPANGLIKTMIKDLKILKGKDQGMPTMALPNTLKQ